MRDGLLYVLTHRSSYGTLIDEVLQKPRFENDWDPFLIFDFFEIRRSITAQLQFAALRKLESCQRQSAEVWNAQSPPEILEPRRASSL
jgi:hypothetical protein